MMKKVIVIPARMQSKRLPGKPLIDIMGKTVLQRTWERCRQVFNPENIFVATDHKKIAEHCDKTGMNVIMTSSACLTGTDRVAEFAEKVDADIYINVQGDEPLINPGDIQAVSEACDAYPGEILNGYAGVSDEQRYRSRTIPKVVLRPDGRLLYMSRSPIPGNKQDEFRKAWRQICIYAFTKNALRAFSARKEKTELENLEDIEILRFLELGYDVRMIELSADSVSVDTPEDVRKVKEILANET